MSNFKRILVPVDFADCSRKGLEAALVLAAKLGAEVEVFHAWVPPPSASTVLVPGVSAERIDEMQRLCQKEAEVALGRFLDEVLLPPNVKVTTQVAMGAPEELILAHGRSFDLIVMGAHGRRGLAHLFLGSVTIGTMRSSATPVMVVNTVH
jgi:nucleotide-binding universal stress UspA family protein